MEKSVGNAAYIANNVEAKQSHPEDEYIKDSCTVVFQKIMPSMSKVYLYVRSNTQDEQSTISRKNLFQSCQALEAQGIVEVISIQPFIIKTAAGQAGKY